MKIGDTDWPDDEAPGGPGSAPTWTSSSKDLVGTTLGPSRIWFTLGYGIVNEVYYPRVDTPQIRDLGFIVADGDGFWCEVKRLDSYTIELPASGIPAPRIVHRHDRFGLELRLVPDPERDVLLIEVNLFGDAALRPYVLLAPHLGGSGHDNVAAAGQHYGRRVVWAEQGPFGLALAAVGADQSDALGRCSAGYVGCSDGWHDFDTNGAMAWTHERAGPGNVALLGELERECVVALGFGSSRGAAASLAIAALARPFNRSWDRQINDWTDWHDRCAGANGLESVDDDIDAQLQTSRMVLRCHMDKINPGAMVASLSIPWGNTKDDRGGYHLVWPRDLVECATALLGFGGEAEARDVLRYLIATQYGDGHWNQNQWLGGTPFWCGVQLDEAALPVLLAVLLHEREALDGTVVTGMIRRALGFLVRMGPITDQDRWEEDRGINAFTVAVAIAALVAGSQLLSDKERAVATDVADDWNARLESWLYVSDSDVARHVGVAGHYIRIAPEETIRDPSARHRVLPIRNLAEDPGLRAENQVSGDFLQLVRFGLRSPDDPAVLNTLKVVDALLCVDTPQGPSWRRYNEDGYGEHDDGRPYDGTGRGRLWPLLTGERGHFELLAGNDARPYLHAMVAMAGRSGMLPEQIWDVEPIPMTTLAPGRPTGSAMPLAWTHAEFVKLLASWQAGHTFDCPRAVMDRYGGRKLAPRISVWSEHAPSATCFAGTDLRINLEYSASIRWRFEPDVDWCVVRTQRTLPGVYSARLNISRLEAGASVEFELEKQGLDEERIVRHTVMVRA